MTNQRSCKTCKTITCEYYNQRNVYYGTTSYYTDTEYTIALTPATFTSKKGCGDYT